MGYVRPETAGSPWLLIVVASTGGGRLVFLYLSFRFCLYVSVCCLLSSLIGIIQR